MNQNATSIATFSFLMSVNRGARQSSKAGSQSRSAAARDGHKLVMMKATAIARRIAFPGIRISNVSHSAAVTAEPRGALRTFARTGADRVGKRFLTVWRSATRARRGLETALNRQFR